MTKKTNQMFALRNFCILLAKKNIQQTTGVQHNAERGAADRQKQLTIKK